MSGKNILMLLCELDRIAECKILSSASLDLAKQKVLHQIWKNNDVVMQKIRDINREIEYNHTKIINNTAVKRDDIEQYKLEKQQLEQKNTTDLTRLM